MIHDFSKYRSKLIMQLDNCCHEFNDIIHDQNYLIPGNFNKMETETDCQMMTELYKWIVNGQQGLEHNNSNKESKYIIEPVHSQASMNQSQNDLTSCVELSITKDNEKNQKGDKCNIQIKRCLRSKSTSKSKRINGCKHRDDFCRKKSARVRKFSIAKLPVDDFTNKLKKDDQIISPNHSINCRYQYTVSQTNIRNHDLFSLTENEISTKEDIKSTVGLSKLQTLSLAKKLKHKSHYIINSVQMEKYCLPSDSRKTTESRLNSNIHPPHQQHRRKTTLAIHEHFRSKLCTIRGKASTEVQNKRMKVQFWNRWIHFVALRVSLRHNIIERMTVANTKKGKRKLLYIDFMTSFFKSQQNFRTELGINETITRYVYLKRLSGTWSKLLIHFAFNSVDINAPVLNQSKFGRP